MNTFQQKKHLTFSAIMLLIMGVFSSCDFFSGNNNSTPTSKFSFEEDYFKDIRKENGMLVFKNLEHLETVYETLTQRSETFDTGEDIGEDEEVVEELPYIAAFEKEMGIRSARQLANERILKIETSGRDEPLIGHPFEDEILAAIFNEKNCCKVGCTYVYNPIFGGKQYAITESDHELLEDVLAMDINKLDESINEHPSSHRIASNPLDYNETEIDRLFAGCNLQPSTGSTSSGNTTGNTNGSNTGNTQCSSNISAFTAINNIPSLSDYNFTVNHITSGYTYKWTYQENNNTVTLNGPSVSASFQATGGYLVTLNVLDANSAVVETCSKTITVLSDCDSYAVQIGNAIKIEDILGGAGQIKVYFQSSIISSLLNQGISIDYIIFSVNGQQDTVNSQSGYTTNFTLPCDGDFSVGYTVSYKNSGTACQDITGSKNYTITSNSCCVYEASHLPSGLNQYVPYSHGTQQILYRFCIETKKFIPRNYHGSRLIAQMKYRTKNNNGKWVKKYKRKLKISFNGSVYKENNNGCACSLELKLTDEAEPSKESNIKRFSFTHKMIYPNFKVTAKQMNQNLDGSWNVRFQAVGTSTIVNPVIKVPHSTGC